jgi:CRP-like cAMP-binding protein
MTPNQDLLIHFIRTIMPMPQDKAEAIACLFHEKNVANNELLLKAGRQCTEFHFLCSGFMRAWTVDLKDKAVTTAFYQEGMPVCELFSFFKHQPSKENIQALADSTSLYITFDELQQAFHTMPEFREFGRSNLINAYAGLKQRMLSTLHQTAEQRYRDLLTSAPEILQYASLKHVASYLGVTDTSLSRIRKEFAKENTAGG